MRKSRAKLLVYRYDAGLYSGGLAVIILRDGDEIAPMMAQYFGESWEQCWTLVDTLTVIDSLGSRVLRSGYHEG